MRTLPPPKKAVLLRLIRQRQREITNRQSYDVTKEELAEWLTLQAIRRACD